MLIGLTGGISSGKSTVATIFTELKIPVIKADEIVHSLMQPSSVIYKEIINKLGRDILCDSLELNKNKLRKIILNKPQIRIWLEELLHPSVYRIMEKQIQVLKSTYCVLEIPLLIEKPPPFVIDRILVIDCSIEQQITRTKQRNDNISEKDIRQIIAIQIARQDRLLQSHDIITNNGSLQDLKQAVIELHTKYLAMLNKQ